MSEYKTPIVILNFKTYLESTGKNALKLAKALENVAKETGIEMAAAPQTADIYQIANSFDIPILAQNIDAVDAGGHTGSNLIECLVEAGISGTLINHSEQRMELADIDMVIKKAKENNIASVVCTNNVATSVATAELSPDFIAVEPLELIGSGIPVSQAEPEVVEGTVAKVKNVNNDIKVLCGAGISTGDDMRDALDLGSLGVLLASGIILAKDPEKALMGLAAKI